MKIEPSEDDKKISPLYLMAYGAFLLIPCFAFYKGWQNHSAVAMIISSVAILGFSTLLTLGIKHNKKVAQRDKQ